MSAVPSVRDQSGRRQVVSAVHPDVPFAGRGRRPLRVRGGRGPQLGAGGELGHGHPLVHRLTGAGDGVRCGSGHNVHGDTAQGRRLRRAVRHLPVRLPVVRRGPGAHRPVRDGAAGRGRRGLQAVPDRRARVGHGQPHVFPAARRERDMDVGRQLPVQSLGLSAGVQGHGLPGPRASGTRLRRVRVRVAQQLCRLRTQQYRVAGCLHAHTARVRPSDVTSFDTDDGDIDFDTENGTNFDTDFDADYDAHFDADSDTENDQVGHTDRDNGINSGCTNNDINDRHDTGNDTAENEWRRSRQERLRV